MRRLRARVREYYSGTIERHGPTPRGVDWPNAVSQYLRFVQLLKVCDFERPFSLNDFGCGYGALLEFMAMRHAEAEIAYRGIDISASMIAAARERWPGQRRDSSLAPNADAWPITRSPVAHSMSGSATPGRLGSYVETMLSDLQACSRVGFAVNFMLPHDDKAVEDELYRSPPARWVAFCRQELDCVRVLRGYGLREFTLLIRRKPRTAAPRQAGSRKAARRSPR